MDNIEIDLNEISTIEGVEIDSDKLQNINLGFGEIIYVDKEDITDHDKLNNLDYESSGHTGFASSKEVAEINERLGEIDTAPLKEQIEKNRNNISTVSESVSAISNDYLKSEDKLALENSISENSEAITNLSNAQNTMSEEIGRQIDGINTNIAQNAQDIINVSNAVDAHGEDIVKIDSRISEIEKDYLTSSDAQTLLSEVNKVSEKAGEVDKRVETIEGDYLSSEDKTELQNSITATNTQLSEVSTQLVNVGTRVGDIENDYLTSGDKASLQEQISANANSITVLSEGIDPEKIDGLKEVTEYVNNHLIEVVYLDQKITANSEALEAQQEEVASISNRVKAIEDDYATGTDFTNLNNQVQGMYTNAQIDSALSGKQPVGDYALDSDLSELSTQVGAIDERVTELEEGGSEIPSGEPLLATYNITSANTTISIKQMRTPTSIDWGDGTLLEDVSSVTTYTHTYASSGVYIVKIYGNINSFWTSSTFANQKQLTKIVLPNTITSYSNRAFEGCTNLIEVKLSNNGNNITDYLFKGCSSLKEINIPACVVRIGSTAFRGTSIQSMVIPRSVTTIAGWNFGETLKDLTIMGSPTLGEGVFYYSENLSTLRMMGSPPTLPSRAFNNTNTQIIVPSKYLNDYKTAWSEYADQIDAYALVGELPEDEDVSLPIASTDTLGGVKVGESMQIDESGVIDTKPLSYIYCSTADTSVNNIDGDGIQCTIYEIEVETQTEDGSVHYEYARDNEIGIPIVAGEGISITKNSNNKAEIGVDDIPTSKLFKDVNEIEIGHIDINNLYSSNAGIVYFSDVSFMDDNGGDLAKSTAYHRLPIVAGEGISIAENSDRTKAVISADGLATESYVDTKVANLVNSAPETLNTLGELATAIQNHEDEYDALLETVGNKANKSDLATVATSGNYNDLSNKPTIPTYGVATSTANGLMPSGDKKKVDYIQSTQLGVSIGENAYNAGHSGANDIMLGKNATQAGNNVACSNSAENSAIAIGHYANASGTYGINIGTPRQSTNTSQFGAKAPSAIAIGADALASNEGSIAVGDGAKSSANYAVQIGTGTNSTANTLQFRDYTLVNADGGVPTERLFKDVNYIDESVTIDELDTDNGISLLTTTRYYNNGKKLATVGGYSWLPLVPGNGISFATNDSNNVEISVERKPYTVFFSLGSAVYITMLVYLSKEENKTIGSGTKAELLSRMLEILFERGITMPMLIGRYSYYNIVTSKITAKDTIYIEYLRGSTLKIQNLTINSSSNVTSLIVTPMA